MTIVFSFGRFECLIAVLAYHLRNQCPTRSVKFRYNMLNMLLAPLPFH